VVGEAKKVASLLEEEEGVRIGTVVGEEVSRSSSSNSSSSSSSSSSSGGGGGGGSPLWRWLDWLFLRGHVM